MKVIALSVDPVESHARSIADINRTQDIHTDASTTSTVRSLFVIDPAKKIRLTPAATARPSATSASKTRC